MVDNSHGFNRVKHLAAKFIFPWELVETAIVMRYADFAGPLMMYKLATFLTHPPALLTCKLILHISEASVEIFTTNTLSFGPNKC